MNKKKLTKKRYNQAVFRAYHFARTGHFIYSRYGTSLRTSGVVESARKHGIAVLAFGNSASTI
ncbi:hypothetical protein RWE15_07170 [Virgibacillus halophilus]|uniref:Uncharacterized protein n=1 Tax=Tigheibacillus halophilus TaxID=361280 RepID=A0ABU5C4Z6_9BACI|nr:hypothetical protein [Virgibacillus halophilus]